MMRFSRMTCVQLLFLVRSQLCRDATLTALGVIALVEGIARQTVAPGQVFATTDVPFTLITIGFVFAWVRYDANQCGYRRSLLFNTMVVGIAVVAVPHLFIAHVVFLAGSEPRCSFYLLRRALHCWSGEGSTRSTTQRCTDIRICPPSAIQPTVAWSSTKQTVPGDIEPSDSSPHSHVDFREETVPRRELAMRW